LAALWDAPAGNGPEIVARRAEALSAIPQRTVPDYCEMTVVSNATGLVADVPGFHAPVARTIEVPELFRPKGEGGLLTRSGIIDVFNCLRRPDEASFAGGVFVVVRFDDKAVETLLRGKGIPTSRDGTHALLYDPSHLLGVEAPLSLLLAVGLGHASCGDAPRPVSDLVAKAARPFKAGERFVLGERHAIEGFIPQMLAYDAAAAARALPYYMAAGQRATRDIAAGALVTYDVVEAPDDSILWELRAEQDARFGAGSRRAAS
jgi:predicted homoserine dehydrogenase-like protein